jgi:intracellular multiplication protein IcmV
MALKDVFKVSRKTFINPAEWVDADNIAKNSKSMFSIVKRLFVIPTATHTETFEEASTRLNLTEKDVKERQEYFYFFAYIFLVLGLATFFSSFFFLVKFRTFAGFILALATSSLFFAQAFRYHFWYFQTKVRKLGCTFDDWYQGFFKNEKA